MHQLARQVSDYKSLKRTIADLEEKLKQTENEIKAFMGDTEEIVVDGDTVRWKKYEQTRFDSAAFKEQHEAMYRQFTVTTQSRRFTIT